jgi:hypothetical protein
MDVKRWKYLFLAVVAALSLASVAEAAPNSSARTLRTSRVSQKSATGTVTFADFADPEGASSGILRPDSLVVIDEIDFTAVAGGADENWTLVVKDDSGDEMFRLMQTATASTADNIAKVFPSGLPLWNGAVASSTFTPSSPLAICRSGYSVVVTNATDTGYLTIFWHYEAPADRGR